MVDIHCHIVPGVDDGAVSVEMSLAMIEEAKRSGVTAILTTPHIHGNADDLPRHAFHKEKFKLLTDAKPDIELYLGGEVRVTSETHEVTHRPEFTSDEKSKYILLELEFDKVPAYFSQLLFEYRLRGITPIVAHPERNAGVLQNIEHALEFVRQGALLQVTTGSLIGELGESFQQCAIRLMESGLVSILASDAHNLTSRRFTNWPNAYEYVQTMSERLDLILPINADDICSNNPLAVCRGTSITPIAIEESVIARIRSRLHKNVQKSVKRKRFFFM